MTTASVPLDTLVRQEVYRAFVEDGRAPRTIDVAEALGRPLVEVEEAFLRLADEHVLVLDGNDIRFAMPFSADETPFRVEAGDRTWWGVCAWDALGILAMLDLDGRVATRCPDCDEPIALEVVGGALQPAEDVAHFAVPAARWWDDIGFT